MGESDNKSLNPLAHNATVNLRQQGVGLSVGEDEVERKCPTSIYSIRDISGNAVFWII